MKKIFKIITYFILSLDKVTKNKMPEKDFVTTCFIVNENDYQIHNHAQNPLYNILKAGYWVVRGVNHFCKIGMDFAF